MSEDISKAKNEKSFRTPAQLEALAQARLKANEVRKKNQGLRQKQRALEIANKADAERKIHEEYEKRIKSQLEEKDELEPQQDEEEEEEPQVVKRVIKKKKPAKKPVVILVEESDSDEEEQQVIRIPKKKSKPVPTPVQTPEPEPEPQPPRITDEDRARFKKEMEFRRLMDANFNRPMF